VVELIPDSYVTRLNLSKIFGRVAPVQVDLGCGDGSFLSALAERMPEKNFLGVERLIRRVCRACRKAERIDNMRVIRVETSYAVRYLLPEQSVQVFHLLFPDPWPKRRHERRRVMTSEFLRSVHCALAPEGLLRIATDQLDYFDQMQRLARADPQFAIVDPLLATSIGVDDVDLPISKFERKFQQQGVPIHRLALRKVSPVM
jgi:tRNA (guanine-N7-)-methyltransferase